MKPVVSAPFLNDLRSVCPIKGITEQFLRDLGLVSAGLGARRSVRCSVPQDLASLGQRLDAWRAKSKDLLGRYLRQLPNDDPLLSPISLFGTLDYGRLETAHTRALAWLLSDEVHGFGFRLLESLLARLVGSDRQLANIHAERVIPEFFVTTANKSKPLGRIDILAEGTWVEANETTKWRLAIEAKIDAEEGEDQLRRYDDWLGASSDTVEVIRVFLTPDGRSPSLGDHVWLPLSFLDLAITFRQASNLESYPGYHFLRFYLTGILKDVCRLPIPIRVECDDPYSAADYLRAVVGKDRLEPRHA